MIARLLLLLLYDDLVCHMFVRISVDVAIDNFMFHVST